MQILIVDRDFLASQLLLSRLEGEGHTVTIEPTRKIALERINEESFDVVFIDPAPLPSVRPMTLPLRWSQRPDYFYLIQMGHIIDREEVVHCGLNDVIAKPYDWQDLALKMANAKRMTEFMRYLHASDEIQSDGVIFGKRAFYQLTLSALDRCYRYGESAYLLMIRITNLPELEKEYGELTAKTLMQSIVTFLAGLRRLSDFLGHTDTAEYGLLLLRPAVDTEPLDAAERFALALQDYREQLSGARLDLLLQLWALPSAEVLREVSLTG